MALPLKDEFVNTTDGWVGVCVIAANGAQSSTAVEPHGFIWLSEDEQILTANAPRSDDDNPFVDRPVRDESTGEPVLDENGKPVMLPPLLELRTRGRVMKSRRPWGGGEPDGVELPADGVERSVEIEETGATPAPAGEPEEGERADGEEVATPDAAAGAGRRRRTKATA